MPTSLKSPAFVAASLALALALATIMGAAVACSSFSDAGSGDAGAVDGGGSTEAGDATTDVAAPPDCKIWQPGHGAIIRPSPLGHETPGSCQLCKSTSENPEAVKNIPAPASDGTYSIAVYVRAETDATKGARSKIGIQFSDLDGGTLAEQSHFEDKGLTLDWTPVESSVVAKGAVRGVFSIAILGGEINTCIDFDDVVLTQP